MPSATAQPRRILVVGAGGLGFACAFALAHSTESEFVVVLLDNDTIELSNLNRQLLFAPSDVGQSKAERLSERQNEIRPGRILAQVSRFTKESAERDLQGIDLLIDCTDSVETKLLINDLAVERNLPFIYGGAIGEEGVALFRPGAGAPCLRCLFGIFSAADLERYGASCSRAGILGPIAGMIGVLQAQLALKWLLHGDAVGALLYRLSSERPTARLVTPRADPDCPISCASPPALSTVQLDLTAERCPMTFLYTKLAYESLRENSSLIVRFADLETAESVYRSSLEAGYGLSALPSMHQQGGWQFVLSRGVR